MTDLVERLRPALALLPVDVHDTPDYAEVTGPDFQAMTMRPDAFLALNSLPDLLDRIQALEAELVEARGGLAKYADTLCEFGTSNEGCGKYPDEICFGCSARAFLTKQETV